jgi:hypothetical protein
MKTFFETVLGFNLAIFLRGLRFGLSGLGYTSRAACALVQPFQRRAEKDFHAEFNAIPVQPVETVLGERKPELTLRVMQYEDGMMPFQDAIALLSLLVAEQPKQVLEIGTFMGHTTRAMAENLVDAIIHTADLPPDFSAGKAAAGAIPKDDFHLIGRRIVGREFKGRPCEKRIIQHLGDTAEVDFKQFGQPTFFFIDGSHTYEYCKSDSEKCLALCPRGGTFLWHDCTLAHPGVVRLVSEWRAAGRNVIRLAGTNIAYWKAA